MPTQLIAVGTGAANSADIVVTDTPVTVCLKDAVGPDIPGECVIDILLKDDSGAYFQIGQLRGGGGNTSRAVTLSGRGTYRLSRAADIAVPCGAFSA